MIWYPYEQMKTMKEPYKILDAEGVHLYTKDQKLIDSISSWWCMIHGYKHPELTAAIKEQADRFCHVMLGGLTHEPVEKLSDKLQEFLPGDLDYCFFSDSGSVAVEVSLKMALQYNTNQGRKRPLVLALEHAYHGDTFKAMEVGDDEDYHFAFDKKEGVVHIPTEIPALEEAFELYHDRLNCFIVEPLLQGAGGMRMYDISFLKRARELCDQYDVLLIFDEVITGFRLAFGGAAEYFGVTPDLVTYGKIIGAGMPVGAYGGRREIMELVSPVGKVYQAGTLSGNPIAMAAGLTQLKYLYEHQEIYKDLEEKGKRLYGGMKKILAEKNLPYHINHVSSLGSLFFTEQEVVDYTSAKSSDTKAFSEYFKGMLAQGIHMAPSQFEAMFLSVAHTDEIIDQTLEAVRNYFTK